MPSIEPYNNRDLPERFLRWIEVLILKLRGIPEQITGEGSPEGVVSAPIGTRYFDENGVASELLEVIDSDGVVIRYARTAGTKLWFKSTASGNTGWISYG